jgi:hypothetical protein
MTRVLLGLRRWCQHHSKPTVVTREAAAMPVSIVIDDSIARVRLWPALDASEQIRLRRLRSGALFVTSCHTMSVSISK